MAVRTFVGGIHPSSCKFTGATPIAAGKLPAKVLVPAGYSWVGYKILAPRGTEVKVGQKLADNEGFMCVPTHSPVSGKVVDVKPYRGHNGMEYLGFTIESDGAQELHESIAPLPDPDSLSAEDIRKYIREAGMLGLGGAEFPTHVKMTLPQGCKVDTLVVNGGECEPYLTADHRVMVERAERVVHGTYVLMKGISVDRAVIGVEDNKMDAVIALTTAAASYKGIEVVACKAQYPQGYEKSMVKATLNREVPPGGLPRDVGVVVVNRDGRCGLRALPHGASPHQEDSDHIRHRRRQSRQHRSIHRHSCTGACRPVRRPQGGGGQGDLRRAHDGSSGLWAGIPCHQGHLGRNRAKQAGCALLERDALHKVRKVQ